jgi:bile acid-coenzyme A ligase
MRETSLNSRLRERGERVPGEMALVTQDRGCGKAWTWAELDAVTSSLAADFTEAAGKYPHPVLLLAVDNDATTVLRLIAALRTDCAVTIVPRNAPEPATDAMHQALLLSGRDVVPAGERIALVNRGRGTARPLPPESLLLPTSGSAGKPKMVVDARLRAVGDRPRAGRLSTAMNWRPGQRQLVVGPLYHTAALTYFVEGLHDGNLVVVPRSFDPHGILSIIREWRVEWLQATPYHLRHLALAMRDESYDFSSIRGLLHSAAPCPAPLKRQWIDIVGPERLFETYGSTEGIGVTLARGDEWLARPGTVGRGFFTQIRVVDEDGGQVPSGVSGKIYMRSGSLNRRLYLDNSDSNDVTPDGFACIDDRGWLDDDGYLYLAPRQIAHIKIGGETVYPNEVESILMEHPAITDAGVVGILDDRLGEALVALVVPASNCDASALRGYMRARVARYKVPRLVAFVEKIPHVESGKPDRDRLAELAAAIIPQHSQRFTINSRE